MYHRRKQIQGTIVAIQPRPGCRSCPVRKSASGAVARVPGLFAVRILALRLFVISDRPTDGSAACSRGFSGRLMPVAGIPALPYLRLLWFGLFLSGLVMITPAFAGTTEDKGYSIVLEQRKRQEGFGDSVVDALMILRGPTGHESIRHLRSMILETGNGSSKAKTVLEGPSDTGGAALLSWSHRAQADEQWLYLPAANSVQTIPPERRSGSFMGSEFAYEDFFLLQLHNYRYSWIKDESLEGKEVCIVELVPEYSHSGYSRIVNWIEATEFYPMKIEYFDQQNRLFKTLRLTEYRKYLGKFWRAHKLEMTNHQSGESTSLYYDSYRFRTGLHDHDFSQSMLAVFP